MVKLHSNRWPILFLIVPTLYIFTTLPIIKTILNSLAEAPPNPKETEMTSEIRLIKVGPPERSYRGYPKHFDLKGHNEISQIFVSAGESGITSIQFQYVQNGKYELSGQYGSGVDTSHFHTIELNHPAEYITGVNGIYDSGPTDNIEVITFSTNIKQYGPFGITNATRLSQFRSPRTFSYNLAKSSQFGGFHGIYDSRGLLSVGVYLSAKTMPPNSGSLIPKKET